MGQGERRNIPSGGINGRVTFGDTQVDKRLAFTVTWLLVALLIGLAFTLTINQPVPDFDRQTDQAHSPKARGYNSARTLISVGTAPELINWLKKAGLWEVSRLLEIPPVVFANFPGNFHTLTDLQVKKRAFLHTLLPSVLIALREVREERYQLEEIIKRMGRPAEDISFSSMEDWQSGLTGLEADFIEKLTSKYRTTKASELLIRVDTIPVSLVLAQGVVESSWGGSRFARTGNNIFGTRTWDEDNGMVPEAREDGEKHRLDSYGSILDSVRAYLLNLNRQPAYRRLRELRQHTDDSLQLAKGLLFYSEKKEQYVQDLQQVINDNRLRNYDQYLLAATPPVSTLTSDS